MLKALICLSVLSVACSAAEVPPPVAAFDPKAEIVEIPHGSSADFSGWYAMSPRTVQAMMDADIERERQCKTAIGKANVHAAIAEAQAEEAVKVAGTNSFWQRYGFILGVASGIVTATAVTVAIWGVAK